MHNHLCCIIRQPWSIFSSSFLIRILCPLSTVPVRLIPSILRHSSAYVLLVVPTIASPSIGIPKITSTSCNVIVVSPCGRCGFQAVIAQRRSLSNYDQSLYTRSYTAPLIQLSWQSRGCNHPPLSGVVFRTRHYDHGMLVPPDPAYDRTMVMRCNMP